MTDQCPEEIINDNPEIDFEELDLYDVLAWDETKKELSRYPFLTKPDKEKIVRYSCLWRGYIATYRLTLDNEFIFEKMSYPTIICFKIINVKPDDDCFEKLKGNFWLIFSKDDRRKSGFLVPFVNGRLITDKNKWKRINSHIDRWNYYSGYNLHD